MFEQASNYPHFWVLVATIIVSPFFLTEICSFFFVIVQSLRFWLGKRSNGAKLEPSAETLNSSISIVVPAFNEEAVIVDAVNSILGSHYKDFDVIVINDGSTDQTLEVLRETFQLEKVTVTPHSILSISPNKAVYRSKVIQRLTVIDKKYTGNGKADALNTGICYASGDFVCVVDADSMLAKDSLAKIMMPFREDHSTVAVGGTVRSGNPSKGFNPIVEAQKIEYSRIFFMDRVVLSKFNLNYIISGAFGVFKKSALLAIGGYQKGLAEDMDLTLRLHRYHLERGLPYKISHAEDALCWTEVPFKFELLERQRRRWQAGFIQGIRQHFDIVGKRQFGKLGMLILPYCMIALLEPLFVLLSLGLTILGFIHPKTEDLMVVTYLACHVLFSCTYLTSIAIEKVQCETTSWGSVAKRYLTWLAVGKIYDLCSFYFRLGGYKKYLKNEVSWGHMDRVGLLAPNTAKHPIKPMKSLAKP